MSGQGRSAAKLACDHEWSLLESRQRGGWYECLLCGATMNEVAYPAVTVAMIDLPIEAGETK